MASQDLFQSDTPVPGGQAMPTGVPLGVQPSDLEFNEEAVTPEEQATYNQFVMRAQEFISSSAENLIGHMNDSKQQVFKNVGKTALQIAQMVSGSARTNGEEISPDIMFHGGTEIVELLMELGDAAGIWPFKQESEEYDQAQAMALMHGAELAGNQMLDGPNFGEQQKDAENFLGTQIAGEQERGEVAPEFYEGLQGQFIGGA